MPKTMDRCLDAPPGINHREPVQGHGIEEPFYIHAPESFAMMNLTPVLGLLGILAGWASCTTSPETGQLWHAPHVGNFWAPMELQRWYYADLDSTRSILEAGIRAAEANGDHTSALANRCLLAEALIFHAHPEARTWIAELPRWAPPGQVGLHTAWAQYYLGRWHGRHRQWQQEDSLLRLVLLPPQERLGPDLFLRAKIRQVRMSGQRGQLHQADSMAGALRPLVDVNGSPRRLSELLQAQATAHMEHGDPQGAESMFMAAWTAARTVADPVLEGQCLLGVASAQIDQGLVEQCAMTAVQANRLFAQAGDLRDRVLTRKLLGYCYWDVLSPREVLDEWLPAKHHADSLGMLRESAGLALLLAKFRVSLDSASSTEAGFEHALRFPAAYALIDQAEQIADELHDPELLAQVANTRSKVLNWEGRYEESVQGLRQAMARFQAAGNQQFVHSTMIGIASNEIARGHWKEAIGLLEAVLPRVERDNYHQLRLLALNRLSFAHEQLAHFKEALAFKDRWHALKDSLEGLQLTDKLAQTELRHAFAQRQLADSLAHQQTLELERTVAAESVQRLRLRSIGLAGGGVLLALGGTAAYWQDRKRRHERYARQAAQLEIKALRAQMNPHFIFNALNSISAFIRQQQPEKAHHFVARFGKLMRLVLENSRRAEVPLARELDVLQVYLELEQARTGDAFEFSILTDPLVNPEEVRVPPLVMQPFVENAVWHGMAGKEGRGQVEISICLREGDLVTTISDDGTGMPKDRPGPDGGRSLGTVITQERLQQLSAHKGRPAGFQYLERGAGTCVEVVIPV